MKRHMGARGGVAWTLALWAALGCGGSTPAPEIAVEEPSIGAPSQPGAEFVVLHGELLLPRPISEYPDGVRELWDLAQGFLAEQRQTPPPGMSNREANEWLLRWGDSLSQLGRSVSRVAPILERINGGDPDQQLFVMVVVGTVKAHFLTLFHPHPDPFDPPGQAQQHRAWSESMAAQVRGSVVEAFHACVQQAPTATLSDWGPRCSQLIEALPVIEAPPTVQTPEACRSPYPLNVGDMILGFPTHEGQPGFILNPPNHVEGLDADELRRISERLETWLREQGATVLTQEQVRTEMAPLMSLQCARPTAHQESLPRLRPMAVLGIIEVNGTLVVGPLPFGRGPTPSPLVHTAPLRGEISDGDAWVRAVDELERPSVPGFRETETLGDVIELLMGRGMLVTEEVAFKVTGEVFGATPRMAIREPQVWDALGACIEGSAAEFTMLEARIQIDGNGNATGAVANSSNAQVPESVATCVANALQQATFSCPISGGVETLVLNVCVR